MGSSEKLLIDTSVLFVIFPFNVQDLRNYRLFVNKLGLAYAKQNIKMAAFDIATSKFSWEINAFLFLELCSVKQGSSKIACAKQMVSHSDKGALKLDKTLDPINFEIACLLGACIDADIKDCYHYVFALQKEVSIIVTEDKDFEGIDKWLRSHNLDSLIGYMIAIYRMSINPSLMHRIMVEKRIKEYFTNPNLPTVKVGLEKFVEEYF